MLKRQNKIPKPLGAVIVIIIGLAAPIYGLRDFDWSSVEATPFSIGVPILYLCVVLLCALAALGITGKQITSQDRDAEIKRKFDAGYRKMFPHFVAIWFCYVIYLVWRIYSKT